MNRRGSASCPRPASFQNLRGIMTCGGAKASSTAVAGSLPPASPEARSRGGTRRQAVLRRHRARGTSCQAGCGLSSTSRGGDGQLPAPQPRRPLIGGGAGTRGVVRIIGLGFGACCGRPQGTDLWLAAAVTSPSAADRWPCRERMQLHALIAGGAKKPRALCSSGPGVRSRLPKSHGNTGVSVWASCSSSCVSSTERGL